MNKKEQRLRDEITYWSNHQELDKFNYSANLTTFFMVTTILLTIVQAVNGYNQNNIASFIIFSIFTAMILFMGLHVYYTNQDTNHHFYVRGVMIEKRYCGIHDLEKGEFRKKLEEEFSNEKKNLDISLWKKVIGIISISLAITAFFLIIQFF